MDLFQLLGKISIDNAEANKALDETSRSGEQAESKLGKAFSAVGKGAVVAGKAIGAGMLAGGAAVAGLVAKSVDAYADYEQLVGGVETLFKDSAGKVQAYANQAYQTAGLSANEYMETVTSFSASLLQSLDGDTAKAADAANQAIIDMSDNANKMGSSMESIQNAYQGFAKQNYTMLDNLKLGYGGTKEEMSRLLADAQAISGIEYDISSYADVVDAIHVIQTEMGITGTTAKEASSTISGSLSMMKSSWQNVMTAMADENADLGVFIENFVDSVATVAENLMPRIEIALDGVISLIDQLAPVIMDKIPGLLTKLLPSITKGATNLVKSITKVLPGILGAITEVAPQLMEGFVTIVQELFLGVENLTWDAGPQLIDVIAEAFGMLVDMLPTILENIMYTFEALAPALIEGLVSAFVKITEVVPQLVNVFAGNLPSIIQGIVTALVNAMPTIIQALSTVFVQLIDSAGFFIPILVNLVVSLITLLVGQLPTIIPLLVDAVMAIINMIVEQLPVILPVLIEALIAIINVLIEQLPIIIPMLIDACITIIMALIEALPVILKALTDALPAILQAVWDAIVMVFINLPQWFGQIFQGAVEIIKGIWSAIVGFFSGIWSAICQVFAPVGSWFSGIFSGAWEGVKSVFATVGSFFSGIWGDITGAFGSVASWFREKFTQAWREIKGVFRPVGEFFSGIWDTISEKFTSIGSKIGEAVSDAFKDALNWVLEKAIGIINGFIDALNFAIDVINKIPGVSIDNVDRLDVPQFAEGGVVDKPTAGIFGEDGAEAVVPLENNTGWLNKVASQLYGFMQNGNGLNSDVSIKSVELQQMQVSELQILNATATKILEAVLAMDENMGGNLREALDDMTFTVNKREFARLVKGTV